MVALVFVVLLVFLVLIEFYSIRRMPRNIRFFYDTDMNLAEPGEVITVTFRLGNSSSLPMLLTGLSIQFDDVVKIEEDETWQEKHLEKSFSGCSVRYNLTLSPHGMYKGRFRISLKRRGYYELGRVYIETGDFLGLKSEVISRDPALKLTCTARYREDDSAFRDFGGIMGDVSVRRFIHDDPTLTVGYREYTGREPMKMISWNQTAKTGRLMVRVNDHTADSDIAVLVNMEDAKPKHRERGLELARVVCEQLEDRRIPYAFYSNGDLFDVRKGLGKAHLMKVLKAIGVARPACYYGFSDLVDRCVARGNSKRSYVLVTPQLDERGHAALEKLRMHSDLAICVIYEDNDDMDDTKEEVAAQ